jgi:hypothetical protein
MGFNQTLHLIGHLGFIAMWLGVDLRRDNKKMCLKEIGQHARIR